MANPVLSVKPPVAFLHLSATVLSCSALTVRLQLWAWAKGWWAPTVATSKASCGYVPWESHKDHLLLTLLVYILWTETHTHTHKIGTWMKWGHSGPGWLLQAPKLAKPTVCGWKALGPLLLAPRHSTVTHSNPLSHFRNYRDLKKKKKSAIILKGFLWGKSNPRHVSFRIKPSEW